MRAGNSERVYPNTEAYCSKLQIEFQWEESKIETFPWLFFVLLKRMRKEQYGMQRKSKERS